MSIIDDVDNCVDSVQVGNTGRVCAALRKLSAITFKALNTGTILSFESLIL